MPHPLPAPPPAGPASPTAAPTGPSAARRAKQGGRAREVPAPQGPGLAALTRSSPDTPPNTSGPTASLTVTCAPVPASIRSYRPQKITSGTCRRPRRLRSGRASRPLRVQEVESPGEVEERRPQQPLQIPFAEDKSLGSPRASQLPRRGRDLARAGEEKHRPPLPLGQNRLVAKQGRRLLVSIPV